MKKIIKTFAVIMFFGIIIFTFTFAFFTNPSEKEYVSWVKQTASEQGKNISREEFSKIFGEKIIYKGTKAKNCFFFSAYKTKLINKGKFEVIGIFHRFIVLKASRG